MQLISILAAAGLAASTTNALLLPPEIAGSDNDIVTTLPVPIEADVGIHKVAEARSLKLECPGCPLRIPHHGKIMVTTDVPSHLELDFSIEPSEGADRLMLNGFELYPKAGLFRNSLTAVVRPEFGHKQSKRPHIKGRPRPLTVQPLGFGVQTSHIAKNAEDSLELIMIELDIIEVGDVFVNGIPSVHIKLVKTSTGQLMIGSLEAVSPKTTQSNPMDKQEECATLLCRWAAVFRQKLASLRLHKGCGGRPSHSQGPSHGKENNPHQSHHAHGKEDGSHQSHHDHHEEHERHRKNWGLLFKNIASHIVLPVAIGILAGVAASIVGMVAGTFIVYLWRLVARPTGSRRHHRHGHHHKASRHEAATTDEKSGLIAPEEVVDAPPAYVESGLVDDKKPENGV
ncbi:hypothetical protein GGS23DRAFT_592926 [Durotheca rogersii]|uniref:uncharacterized protein n=1 Tax=Durotheca rogersii TaxID=419775 RepID=UPI0022210EE5|nr:uncharacterized protein GGS23DRAFT_592926 [Durotheca rogersii]KAI5867628.1 hypothetical protein GGS23DRAFT_592926 [Durotheca rogersii]